MPFSVFWGARLCAEVLPMVLPGGIMPPVQLTITRDTYAGHAKSPWLVVVPRALSPTGKRWYRRFPTRAAAAAFVGQVRGQVRASGEQPLTVLPANVAADAQHALQLLEGTGLRLADAVQQFMALLHTTGVACARTLQIGGAGAAWSPGTQAPTTEQGALTLNSLLATMDAAKRHQSAATLHTRRGVCRTLFDRVPGLADTALTSCTPAMIQAALDRAWPAAPQSWNSGRRILHALFGYAIKRRLVSMENPVTPLEFKRVQEAEIRALPPDSLRALFAAAEKTPDLQAYLAICAFAGVRPTECSRLAWADVDWEDGVLSVRACNSKTGGTRHIELHPTLRAWLLACKPLDAHEQDPIVRPAGLIVRMGKLRARAGFGGGAWQNDCLRHSYATYYLKAKCGSLHQLQLNMGHRDARLLYTRYTNMRGVTREMAADWWRILPPKAGGGAV